MFNDKILELLNEPLSSDDVKKRKGSGSQQLSYIASYHAINEANRIFGFGQWSTEILDLSQVDRTEYTKAGYNGGAEKEMISISYLCQLQLTIKHENATASHQDTGFGNGVAGNSAHGIGSCIELASKEAVTDALKRCLRYYGNKFGLSLYDKDDDSVMTPDELEAGKFISDKDMEKLRELYDDRLIDDDWVITALKAEGYPNNDFNEMRTDWYQMAYKIAKNYKLEEIELKNYEVDIEKAIKIMSESANFNMLKACFGEVWKKTIANNDKKRQQSSQKMYEEMKAKMEGK